MKRMLQKREPMFLMESIQDELNKILRDTFGEFEFPELSIERQEKTWRPAVEMFEREGSYIIKAEFPGVGKDNIDVELTEDSITLKAETKFKEEEKKENLYRSEFKYGKFLRSIPFPSKIDSSKAKADYDDGVLTITLPKSEEEKEKLTKLKIE